MLNFLSRLRRRADDTIAQESQRQTFERLVAELNGAIDALPDKPRVSIEPATGHVAFDLPDQFPDEALALPSPEPNEDPKAQDEPEAKADPAPPSQDEKTAA